MAQRERELLSGMKYKIGGCEKTTMMSLLSDISTLLRASHWLAQEQASQHEGGDEPGKPNKEQTPASSGQSCSLIVVLI